MSRLDTQQLLNEFFEKEKGNFPNVSYDQFRDIVYGPWMHLKKIMEEGSLDEIRIKYFGNFLVHTRKAQAELANIKKRFDAKTIMDKEYFRIKAMIEKFLNNE